MIDYEYEVDSRLYFVPTEEVNSKGNQVTIPIVVRKMFLRLIGETPTSFRPSLIRIVRSVRGEQSRYCVSVLVGPKPEIWPTLQLKPQDKPRWIRKETLDENGVIDYLRKKIGGRAMEALHELLTKQPVRN